MGDDAPPTPPKAGFAPPPEAPAAGNGTGLTQRVPTHTKRMERVTTSGYLSVPVEVEGTDWTKCVTSPSPTSPPSPGAGGASGPPRNPPPGPGG